MSFYSITLSFANTLYVSHAHYHLINSKYLFTNHFQLSQTLFQIGFSNYLENPLI